MTFKQGNRAHPSLSCSWRSSPGSRESPGRQEFTGTSISRSLLGQGFCLIGLKSHSSPTQAPAEPSVRGIGNLEQEAVEEFALLGTAGSWGENSRGCAQLGQPGESEEGSKGNSRCAGKGREKTPGDGGFGPFWSDCGEEVKICAPKFLVFFK